MKQATEELEKKQILSKILKREELDFKRKRLGCQSS